MRRGPRRPTGTAELFVLGAYPSALHVRWRQRGGVTVGALAVDDEPEVFWDGSDAADRIEAWQATVGWKDEHGTVTLAGGNGSSGRSVVDGVLKPLRVSSADTYFTDCLPFYVTKSGPGSQGQRIDDVYRPFAREHGLAEANLPSRPTPSALVDRTVTDEARTLREQVEEADAARIITLGQEAADVLAKLVGVDRVVLKTGETYGGRQRV
jgi:hypothetical protein